MENKEIIEDSCSFCKAKGKSCFKALKQEDVSILDSEKVTNVYKKKHILFHEGARPLGVYCVRKGKIKVYKRGVDGKEQIVQIAKEGDLLGYRSIISEEPYPVTAETLEDTYICFLTKHDFNDMLIKSTELNNTLLKQACIELGDFTEKITNQAQLSVRERAAIALYKLYWVYGGTDQYNSVEINLTRDDLANIVGTATETFIRLLHDFKEEKIIVSKGRIIKIIDPLKLKKIGHLS